MDEIETKSLYWIEFNRKITSIEELINEQLNSSSSSLINEKINEIKNELNELQIFATRNTEILPKYDIRRSQEVISLSFYFSLYLDLSIYLFLSHSLLLFLFL